MTIRTKRVRVEVVCLETVRQQLNAQGVKLPGHAMASLERSRQAILQLGAAYIVWGRERLRLHIRFRKTVAHTLHTHRGGRWQVNP